MVNSEVLSKLYGSLLFNKENIPFEIKSETINFLNEDYNIYVITIIVDPNRYHRIGDSYDPNYTELIDNMEETLYELSSYVGGDLQLEIKFKQLEPRFLDKLSDVIQDGVKKFNLSDKYINFDVDYGYEKDFFLTIRFKTIDKEDAKKFQEYLYEDQGLDNIFITISH
jgi:hypothetical protein